MRLRTKADIEADQAVLEEEGAKYHKWNEMVDIVGTGKYPPMPEGKNFREHKVTANVLIKKGYAKKA